MKQDFLKQFDGFLFAVPKQQAESVDTREAIDFYRKVLEQHASELKNVQGRCFLSFDGYDDILEELYEIIEIRAWVKRFIDALPFFLFFFDIKTTLLLTLCALDAKKVKTEGRTAYAHIEPDQLIGFVNHHLNMANDLFERAGFGPEKPQEIRSEILKSFGIL